MYSKGRIGSATTTHTPGPWFVNGPWHIQSDVKTELPTLVAHVTQLRNLDHKEREANACLIAASPEMFKACLLARTLLDSMQKTIEVRKAWSDTSFDECVSVALRQLDAAIAKADPK